MSRFLRVGRTDDLDGVAGEVRTLLGKAVRFWLDAEGQWQAMEMVCRHQNEDLSRGQREGDIVTCPRHGWRYDLTTGECLTEGWAGLRRYAVKVEGGDLFVSTRPGLGSDQARQRLDYRA